eukprot:1603633-Prorocentrum_lima.AAC.1
MSLHQQQFFLPGRLRHHKKHILHLLHPASHLLPTIRALTATTTPPTPCLLYTSPSPRDSTSS